jgi:hypothetical protein
MSNSEVLRAKSSAIHPRLRTGEFVVVDGRRVCIVRESEATPAEIASLQRRGVLTPVRSASLVAISVPSHLRLSSPLRGRRRRSAKKK